MSERTVALKFRLTEGEVEKIDALRNEAAHELGRAIPRAAIVRALTRTTMQSAEQRPAFMNQLCNDTVRRGRIPAQ